MAMDSSRRESLSENQTEWSLTSQKAKTPIPRVTFIGTPQNGQARKYLKSPGLQVEIRRCTTSCKRKNRIHNMLEFFSKKILTPNHFLFNWNLARKS